MSNKNHKSNKLRHTICCLYIHGIINAEIHNLDYCTTVIIKKNKVNQKGKCTAK